MKINFRVLIALVVIAFVAFWTFDSVRTRGYSGQKIEFAMGSGPVTINNPGDETVTASLTNTGTRAFTIASSNSDTALASSREGTGSRAVNTVLAELPPGITELSITRGAGVNFAAESSATLEATVMPMTADETRNTVIFAAVVILGALFYISNATGHAWLKLLRNRGAASPVTTEAASA